MAFLESHQTLGRHPKLRRAALRLGIHPAQMVGHLMYLWWWCLDYAEEGLLGDLGDDEIALAAEWPDDPEAFVSTLVAVGWLEETPEGLAVHDWWDYAGRLIEQRQERRQRAKRKRDLYGDLGLTREVRARDGDCCRYCGKEVNWRDRRSGDGGTYDHVDPEGPNAPENIVVACRSCNSRKGRRRPEDAGMRLRPTPGSGNKLVDHDSPDSPSASEKSEPRQVSGKLQAEPSALTEQNSTQHNTTRETEPNGSAPEARTPTGEDVDKSKAAALFETFARLWLGIDWQALSREERRRAVTDDERGRINRAVRGLVKVGASATDLEARWAEAEARAGPGIPVTPQTVAKSWNDLARSRAGAVSEEKGGGADETHRRHRLRVGGAADRSAVAQLRDEIGAARTRGSDPG